MAVRAKFVVENDSREKSLQRATSWPHERILTTPASTGNATPDSRQGESTRDETFLAARLPRQGSFESPAARQDLVFLAAASAGGATLASGAASAGLAACHTRSRRRWWSSVLLFVTRDQATHA
jgi:hypothetical protein